MKHLFLRFIFSIGSFLLGIASMSAGYLTTNRTNMNFYSDPACTKVAHSGIQAGNSYYYEEEPVNGVVCFEFAGEKVYAKLSDVFLEGDAPDEVYDNELDDAISSKYNATGGGFHVPGWIWVLIIAGGAYLAYRLYFKGYFEKQNAALEARKVEDQKRMADMEAKIRIKYRFGQDGCPVGEAKASPEYKLKMRSLNRIATLNPGADTGDPHALCGYLVEYQPVRDTFLREVGDERSMEKAFPNTQDGFHNWCWMRLSVDEYIDPKRLSELSPALFELYKTISLDRYCATDEERMLLAKRAEADLQNLDQFNDEDKIRLYQILCGCAKRSKDVQKQYDYACSLADLGQPYRKEQILKSYKLKDDGVTLNIAQHRLKKIIMWSIVGVVGVAVLAAIALLALYVALFAAAAFVFYMVFKMMVNDATSGWRGSASSRPKTGPNSDYSTGTCGGCLKFDTPHCAFYPVGIRNANDTACSQANK